MRSELGGVPRLASHVVFTGRREDVSAVTADLTVAVLPSLREAQGISILEAMARRVPVVASESAASPRSSPLASMGSSSTA